MKCLMTGQHFVQHATECKDIASRIARPAASLFRRQVCRRPHDHDRHRSGDERWRVRQVRIGRGPFHHLRQSEIQNLHFPIRSQFHVCGFQIAMDDSFFMRRLESFTNLNRDRERFIYRNRTARDVIRKRLTLDEFENQESRTPRFLDVVNARDIGMDQ